MALATPKVRPCTVLSALDADDYNFNYYCAKNGVFNSKKICVEGPSKWTEHA